MNLNFIFRSVGVKYLRRFFCVLIVLFVGIGTARAVPAVGDLSLEEQVGQVLFITLQGKTMDGANLMDLAEVRPGGVILYSAAGNIGTPTEVAAFDREMQRWSLACSGVPLLIGIDQEGGRVARLREGVTLFPGNMALGATGDASLARSAAYVTGSELRALGINVNFAPVLDVNVNPENPVIGDRSFGSSPEEVARFGIAASRGYLASGVLPVVKHFPGHGDTSVDSHLGLPLVPHDRERLEKVELAPFRAAFDAGIPAVMTAHVRVPALEPEPLPATFSQKIFHDLLRNEMGFDGLVFSDSMGMGAISEGWSAGEAAVLAFRAGADMLIYGADRDYSREKVRVVRDALVTAVKSGEISRERLEGSVQRILDVKERLGLFNDPFPKEERLAELASPESLTLARDVARRSLTVLRGGDRLSLGEEGPFVVLWPEKRTRYLGDLRKYCPALQPLVVPEKLTAEETDALRGELSGQKILFVGCFDLFRTPGFAAFLRELPAERLVLLSFRSPYDLLQLPDAGGALAFYGNTAVSLEALNDFLGGKFVPTGVLPVELP